MRLSVPASRRYLLIAESTAGESTCRIAAPHRSGAGRGYDPPAPRRASSARDGRCCLTPVPVVPRPSPLRTGRERVKVRLVKTPTTRKRTPVAGRAVARHKAWPERERPETWRQISNSWQALAWTAVSVSVSVPKSARLRVVGGSRAWMLVLALAG